MKIAYLSPNFPPELGGMGTACYYTANEIGKSHKVTVFLAKRKGVEHQKGNYKIKLFKPWFSYGYADFAPQILCKLKDFDIVHLYYPYYGVAEFLLLKNIFSKSRPKIILHHNMDVVGEGIVKIISLIHRRTIQPLLFKMADMIFILSKDYAEHSDVSKIYKKYPEKFREVPHGVDISKFMPFVIPAKAGIQNDTKNLWIPHQVRDDKNENFIVFTAQALDKQHFFKGIDILIKAIKVLITNYQLPITLMIAGEGPLKKHYQDLSRKLGIADKVKFLGQIGHTELPKYYSIANVTAVPSTARTECFSITAIESMACKTPVIVSDWPGVRVTIENNKSGLIVKPGNEKDLAEKIKYLYEHPEILKKMRENARKRVEEKYDWKIIAKQIIQNYEDLLI